MASQATETAIPRCATQAPRSGRALDTGRRLGACLALLAMATLSAGTLLFQPLGSLSVQAQTGALLATELQVQNQSTFGSLVLWRISTDGTGGARLEGPSNLQDPGQDPSGHRYAMNLAAGAIDGPALQLGPDEGSVSIEFCEATEGPPGNFACAFTALFVFNVVAADIYQVVLVSPNPLTGVVGEPFEARVRLLRNGQPEPGAQIRFFTTAPLDPVDTIQVTDAFGEAANSFVASAGWVNESWVDAIFDPDPLVAADEVSASFGVDIANVYTLEHEEPASGAGTYPPLTVVPLAVRARANGLDSSEGEVAWTAIETVSGVDVTSTLLGSLFSTPVAGVATTALDDAPEGVYEVTATWTPDPDVPAETYQRIFVITIANTYVLSLQTPPGPTPTVERGTPLRLAVLAQVNGALASPGDGPVAWSSDRTTESSLTPASSAIGTPTPGIAETEFVASAGGTHVVTATWDPQGDGVGLTQTFTVQVPLLHTLEAVAPAAGAGSTGVGAAILLRVRALSEGLPASDGSGIAWSLLAGPAGSTLPASSVTTGGESEVAFVPAAAGIHQVEARWDPDGTGTDIRTVVFDIQATDVYALQREQPADGVVSVMPGDSIALAVRILLNGADAPDGLAVAWSLSDTAAGSLDALSTAVSGVAQATFQATQAGTTTATATIDPDGDPASASDDNGDERAVSFSITVPDVVRSLEKPATDSGDGQSGPLGAQLPLPLVVFARNDGTAAPGVLVNWSTTGDAVLGASQTSTDADGSTSIEVVLGSTPGPVTVVASRNDDGAAQASFLLQAVEGEFSLVRVGERVRGGDSGSGIELEVEARLNGEPQVGVPLSWTVESGLATLAGTTTTGAGGRSGNTLTLGIDDQPVAVRVQRSDVAGAETDFFIFNNPILELLEAGGNGSSAPGDSEIELAARALANGEAAAGIRVEFELLEGDAELLQAAAATGTDGVARVGLRLGSTAGTVRVRATWALRPELTVEFVLTNEGIALSGPSLLLASGDGQGAPSGSFLDEPLVVRAEFDGQPQPGVEILWQVTAGSATLSSPASTSDEQGLAQVELRVDGEGPIEVEARRADAPGLAVRFALSGEAAAPGASLVIFDGDGQSASSGAFLDAPLVVRALFDGQPQPGVEILWQVTAGSATLSSPASTSDEQGLSQVELRVDGEGPIEVEARRVDTPGLAVRFALSGVPSAEGDALSIHAGDGQVGTLTRDGEPLVVLLVRDGAPAVGEAIEWEVLSGDASLSSPSSDTDASGLAQVVPRFGTTVGSVLVQARAAAAPPVTFNLQAGSPRLRLLAGGDQAGLAGTTAAPIEIELLEACCDRGIDGEALDWRILGGQATLDAAESLSDASGRSAMGFRFGAPGAIAIEVSAFDGLARLEVAATSLQPTLRIVSGNSQTGAVGDLLVEDFVVAVGLPEAAKSLAGVEITWTVVEGGGSVDPAVSRSDSSGQARARLTLGPEAGLHRISAAIAGGAQVEFSASAVEPAPSGTLVRISGNGQTLPTQADSAPLVVELRDAEGQPLSNAPVQWVGENASLAESTTFTDANGRSANVARVQMPGAASVRASAPDATADEVGFDLNGGVANLTGLSPRQRAVADAIDSLCPMLAALQVPLSAEQGDLLARCLELVDNSGDHPDAVREALDQLSNDVGSAQSSLAFNALRGQFSNIQRRLEARRSGQAGAVDLSGLGLQGGSGVFSLGLLQAEEEGEPEVGTDFDRWSFFASGILGDGRNDATPASRGFDFQTQGLTAGVDYRVNPNLFLGAAIGYSRQDADFRADRGGVDADGFSLTAYGSWYNETDWYLDGVLTWGDLDYDLRRHIRYQIPALDGGTTDVNQTARADIGGRLAAFNLSVGKDFHRGAWGMGTYLRGGLARAEVDAYDERISGTGAGSGLVLAVDSRRIDSRTLTLGGRLNYTASRDWGILMPNLQVEWEREFKDDPQRILSRFLHDPGQTPMLVSGDAFDRDYLNVGVGLSAVLPGGRSAYLFYERLMGKSGESQGSLSLGVRIEF